MKATTQKFTEEEVQKLLNLFLKKFLDIPKILNSLDSDLAESFKKRNGAAFNMLLEKGQISHCHNDGDICEELHSTIFIPKEHQNSVEKLIASETYPPRFRLYLKTLLKEIHSAYTQILEKLKKKVDAGEGPSDIIPVLPGVEQPKTLQFGEEECKQIMK